ncbi:MAG TPA: NADH-quinone oxidoreductase subunit C [Bacteroidales bacterium]|nr:NADH-quinone oxidoreductase subunit C [Bacteroidales bacterium]HPS62224.1 NADH-quinone oxidoreductase subunit C [Bacteroidales bacterium]
MDNVYITDRLKKTFTHDILETDAGGDMLTVIVTAPVIAEVIRFLKEEPDLGFVFLTDLCGIHYPDRGLPLGVVYHLHNLGENIRIRVKTFVTLADPRVPSVTGLFSTANWMERETYDFYGILFEGHPNLKRILNVEYLDFFPLRKEYPLEDPTREDKQDRHFGR